MRTFASDQVERSTGIIRTLPYKPDAAELPLRAAYRRLLESFRALKSHGAVLEGCVWIALPAKPRIEVLHCYILVGGRIIVRANIADYVKPKGPLLCWDGTKRLPNFWAVLTAPVSWPRIEVPMRGFRGFRYVYEPLW